MSVRMKLTHSKTASRRAHHRVGAPRLVATLSGARRRHFADPATGMYRGKQIITIGAAEEAPKKSAAKAKDTAKSADGKDAAKKKAPDAKKK